MITVKTFAQVRELSGCAHLQVPFAAGLDVTALIMRLQQQSPAWREALEGNVLCAVNQTLCDGSALLNDNDEVAFFPPVTGG